MQKNQNSITIDGINYNTDYNAGLTAETFAQEQAATAELVWPNLSAEQRTDKLNQAHALILKEHANSGGVSTEATSGGSASTDGAGSGKQPENPAGLQQGAANAEGDKSLRGTTGTVPKPDLRKEKES